MPRNSRRISRTPARPSRSSDQSAPPSDVSVPFRKGGEASSMADSRRSKAPHGAVRPRLARLATEKSSLNSTRYPASSPIDQALDAGASWRQRSVGRTLSDVVGKRARSITRAVHNPFASVRTSGLGRAATAPWESPAQRVACLGPACGPSAPSRRTAPFSL